MAQAGYTPILIYASGTATNIPTAGNLISGSSGAELAINYADGKLYYKDGSGNVKLLSIGYGSSSVTPTNGGVQYGTGTALALTAAGSSGQILRSNGAAAPTWADLSTLGVNTISFGTTGLTPNSATAGAVTVAGTLVTANGGTGLGGATPFTANGVLYASSASALTSGSALTFDGTTFQYTGAANFATSSGNVGIGTSSPSANYGNLQVTGSAQSSLFAQLGTDTVRMGVRATGRTGIAFDSSNATYTNRMWYIDNIGSVGSLIIGRSGLDVLTFDNSGNLGLGVTPSAWNSIPKVLQTSAGALYSYQTVDTSLLQNCYLNSGGVWTYTNTGYAEKYQQYNGQHIWYTAPSGTANTTTITNGVSYTIITSGDQTSFGAANNNVGTVFTATSSGTLSSGTVSQNITFTQAMTLNASGNLGIGETNPQDKLHLAATGTNVGAGYIVSRFQDAANTKGLFLGYDTDELAGTIYGVNFLTFQTYNGSAWGERMRLDTSGNLGLGVTPSATVVDFNSIEVGSTGNGIYGGTGGFNNTAISSNAIISAASVGSTYARTAAAAQYRLASGAHYWLTAPSGTAGNAITFTQAMTLDESGRLGIGITLPNAPLEVQSASTGNTIQTAASLYYPNNTGGGGSGVRLDFAANNSGSARAVYSSIWSLIQSNSAHSGDLVFGTANSGTVAERARITSGGDFRVKGAGTAGSTDAFQVSGSAPADAARITSGGDLLVGTTDTIAYNPGVRISPTDLNVTNTSATSTVYLAYLNRQSSDGEAIRFGRANSTVGTISVTTTATAYNTSSDYRLKDNQQPLAGSGAFIDALKPKTWDWKSGGKGVGFIAHEVQAVSPASVTGEKDAVDEEGKPVYQAMEYGSAEFIANIIAELQSLRQRVALLEGN